MLKRSMAAMAFVAALALGAAACGGTGDGGGATRGRRADPNVPIKQNLKLAFLPKQVDDPYETLVDDAGIAAARGFYAQAKEVGPSDASASSQISSLNALIQQRQDAILIAANDPNAVCGPLKQAMARGIAVVSYDSDAARECRDVFVDQASAEEIGRSEIKVMSDLLGGRGQIAILSATADASNQNTWIRFMKDELKKPEYAGMKLVKVAYGDDDDRKSFQQAQGLLQAYPDLKGIIAPTTVGLAAAARYVSASRYKGKVEVSGLGTPNRLRKFVKDGTVHKFELWNPGDLGYLAAYAAAALASGQITGAQGETFKAGRLGTRTIGADGEVVLGPPTVFDKTNIDGFHF
jgi:rhamnose transport system substrate-binding protein